MPRYSTRAPSAAPTARPGPVTGRDGPYLGQRRGTVAHRIFGRGSRSVGSGSTRYYSLEEAMDISGDELKSLISLMRAKAFAHLDRALPLGQQDPARLARYIEECSSLRGLQRYRDGLRCWPAKIYAKIYLSRTSTRLQRSNLNNSQPEAEPDEPVAVPAQTPRPSQSSSGSSGSVGTGSSLQIDSDDLDSTDQTISFGSSQEQCRESKSPVRSPSDGSSSSQAADASSASTSATHSIPLASVPSSAVEDSVVREFVLRMHPPQPQLYRVLLDAGVETTSHLEFLARETSHAKVFLGRLLEKNKINDFEYTYLDAAIKVL